MTTFLNRSIAASLLWSVLVMFSSCGSSGNSGTISGKIAGAEGKTILLESFVNNRSIYTDSTVIGQDGSFLIKPAQPLEMNFYRLVIDRDNFITLITDSTECPKIEGKFGEMEKSLRVNGSLNSEILRELELGIEPFNQTELSCRERFVSPGISDEEKNMLNQEVINSRRKKAEYIKTWLETHSATPAALLAVQQLDPRTDLAIYNKVFADLESSFGHTVIYKGMKQQVNMLMNREKTQQEPAPNPKLSAGRPAPEIALPDPKGKTRKLSDLKGKTVLIDFWASWCGPCRRENPNVVAAYKKYNKDGFEVFSVSLDKAKEPWMAAIQQDGLIWPNHVSDLKHWESVAAEAYNVHSIPHTVLVDKDGNILGHNLRGPALEAKLQTIYGH